MIKFHIKGKKMKTIDDLKIHVEEEITIRFGFDASDFENYVSLRGTFQKAENNEDQIFKIHEISGPNNPKFCWIEDYSSWQKALCAVIDDSWRGGDMQHYYDTEEGANLLQDIRDEVIVYIEDNIVEN